MAETSFVQASNKVLNRISLALDAYDVVTEYKEYTEAEALGKASLLLQNRNTVVIERLWDNSFKISGVLDI